MIGLDHLFPTPPSPKWEWIRQDPFELSLRLCMTRAGSELAWLRTGKPTPGVRGAVGHRHREFHTPAGRGLELQAFGRLGHWSDPMQRRRP